MEKTKTRYMIEVLIFIIIASVSILTFLPVAKALKSQLTLVRDVLLKKIEYDYGLKIQYSSIYPGIFKKIVIRDVSVYNSENNEKLAFFSEIRLDYRILELLKKDTLSAFSEIKISDGFINVNTVKNKNIFKSLKMDENTKLKETKEELSLDSILNKFDDKLKRVGEIQPIQIGLKNISLAHSSENLSLDFYIGDGHLKINNEKIDFTLDSNFKFKNKRIKWASYISSGLNISGVLNRTALSASSMISFYDLKFKSLKIKKISAFTTYLDGVMAIKTLQDTFPVDVEGVWNTNKNIADLSIKCKEFLPFSIPLNLDKNLNFLKAIAVTGNFSFNLFEKSKYKWNTDFDISSPDFKVGSAYYSKTKLKLKANGNNEIIYLDKLNLSGNDIIVSSSGSYNIKDVLPSFSFNIKKLKLPSKKTLSMNIDISSSPKNVFAFIPVLKIGEARVFSINGRAGKTASKTDFLISAKDNSGKIKIDGSWNYSTPTNSLGYLECHGAMDSVSVNNIFKAINANLDSNSAVPSSITNITKEIQSTSEFYFSTDFQKFSYNIVQMILASKDEEGFYSLFSIKGTHDSVNINNIDILAQGVHLTGAIDANFEKNDILFDSLLTLNDISYKTKGLFSDGALSIYGDYGLNINILKEPILKGSVQAKGLPIPFLKAILSTDCNFEFESKQNWEIGCNYIKLESIDSELSTINNNFMFEIMGNINPKQTFFHTVRLGRQNDQLTGTASLNLMPDYTKNLKTYSTEIVLSDIQKKELFNFNSLISFSDKIYVDGNCQFKNISLNRFLKKQKDYNKLDATIVFLGARDSLLIKTELENLNLNLNDKNLVAKSLVMIDDKQVIVSNTNLNWGNHYINDVKGIITPEERTGNLSFHYAMENKKTKIGSDFLFNLSSSDISEKKDNNILEKIKELTNHYLINMKIDNWNIAGKTSKEPFVASFIRDPGIMAFYAGKNESSYGFKTDDGVVSLHIDDSFPIRFDLDGVIKDDFLKLSCNNIFMDIPTLVSYIPNNQIIEFDSGSFSGALEIKGTKKDPEFFGNLTAHTLVGNSPKYSPENLVAEDLTLNFTGEKIELPYTILKGKKDSVWVEATSDFVGWIPYETEIKCGIFNDLALLKTNNLAFHSDGNVGCELVMNITPKKMHLEGYANFDKGFFSVPFEDLYKIEEKYKDGDFVFTMNLKLNLGRKTEFRYPSTKFPILSAYIYTEEPLVLEVLDHKPTFIMTGSAKIRTGEIFYVKRNFHIKSGDLSLINDHLGRIIPLITVSAEIRDRTIQGEPITISLAANNQPLEMDKFKPKITTSPPMSDQETMMLLGQAFVGESKNDLLKSTLINASDIFAQMGLLKKAERGIRNFLHIDVFSMRTLFLQNVILGNLFNSSSDKNLTLGNYFDNTSVYIGKYFGSAIYADAALHLSYYDSILKERDKVKKAVLGNILFQPEIGLEMNTPFFLLRWQMAPSNPETAFVSDTGLTLSWKFSY